MKNNKNMGFLDFLRKIANKFYTTKTVAVSSNTPVLERTDISTFQNPQIPTIEVVEITEIPCCEVLKEETLVSDNKPKRKTRRSPKKKAEVASKVEPEVKPTPKTRKSRDKKNPEAKK